MQAKLAQDYETVGGAIINVLRWRLARIKKCGRDELMNGIKLEFRKDNRTV
jgi:hypothetical protein